MNTYESQKVTQVTYEGANLDDNPDDWLRPDIAISIPPEMNLTRGKMERKFDHFERLYGGGWKLRGFIRRGDWLEASLYKERS